jgi:hypothetical protein
VAHEWAKLVRSLSLVEAKVGNKFQTPFRRDKINTHMMISKFFLENCKIQTSVSVSRKLSYESPCAQCVTV